MKIITRAVIAVATVAAVGYMYIEVKSIGALEATEGIRREAEVSIENYRMAAIEVQRLMEKTAIKIRKTEVKYVKQIEQKIRYIEVSTPDECNSVFAEYASLRNESITSANDAMQCASRAIDPLQESGDSTCWGDFE